MNTHPGATSSGPYKFLLMVRFSPRQFENCAARKGGCRSDVTGRCGSRDAAVVVLGEPAEPPLPWGLLEGNVITPALAAG